MWLWRRQLGGYPISIKLIVMIFNLMQQDQGRAIFNYKRNTK